MATRTLDFQGFISSQDPRLQSIKPTVSSLTPNANQTASTTNQNPPSIPANPVNPAGNPPPLVDQNDPLTKFNMAIYQMLTQAQGQSSAPFLAANEQLQKEQLNRDTAPLSPELQALNLSPAQQEAIRSSSEAALNPEITNVSDRLKLQNESITRFESLLNTAQQFGQDFLKLNPGPQVIGGYVDMLKNGGSIDAVPSEIRNQVIGEANKDADFWKKHEQAIVDQYKAQHNVDFNQQLALLKLANQTPQGTKFTIGGQTITGNKVGAASGNLQDDVQNLISGAMPPSFLPTRGDYRSKVIAAARAADPSYNPAQAQQQYDYLNNYQTQNQLANTNAAIATAKQAVSNSDKVDRTRFTFANGILLATTQGLSDPNTIRFVEDINGLGDEIGNVLGQGSASDFKTQLGLLMANPKLSKSGFKAQMNELVTLFTNKINSKLKQGGQAPIPGGTDFGGTSQSSNDPLGIR